MPRFDNRSVISESARSLARERDAIGKIEDRVGTLLQRRMAPQAKRDLGQELNLPASRIAAGITTSRTARGVELVGSGRQIGVVSFGGRWAGPKAPGIRVQILRSGGAKVIPGAFIRKPGGRAAATGPQGMRRKVVGGKRAPRYPLERVPTVTIAQSLKKPERIERLDQYAGEIADAEVNRLLKIR